MSVCLRNAAFRRVGRAAIVLVVAATVQGCATSNAPPISSLASGAGVPPPGQSRIIVIRPQTGSSFAERPFPVKLDGQPIGDLEIGKYVSADRPAGAHQLSVDLWDLPGVSRQEFTTTAGRTYYFAASLKERVKGVAAMTVAAGLVGYALAAATTADGTGQVDLIPLSEADAKRAIAAAPQ